MKTNSDIRVANVMSVEPAAPKQNRSTLGRRSFLKRLGWGGAALAPAGTLLASRGLSRGEGFGGLSRGDIAILRFLAAAEILETDLWQQYAELGGDQTNEPPQITGLKGGNAAYTKALTNLEGGYGEDAPAEGEG